MVNDIMVTPDQKRDADAVKLAENGLVWPVVTLKAPWGAFPSGTEFYAVPSRSNPGASYLANHISCQCKDYRRAVCAHIRAVRIYREQTAFDAETAAIFEGYTRHEVTAAPVLAGPAPKRKLTYSEMFPDDASEFGLVDAF